MNQELFDKLWGKGKRPSQRISEFWTFFKICDAHLEKQKIKNPVVVELGVYKGKGKVFYEQLLGAKYIGIDASEKRSKPDILGNTHDAETMNMLKKRLNGKPINILFIDAGHDYKSVKKDYKLYSPLCSDIIAFHDIELGRYQDMERREVWKFWDELKRTHDVGRDGKLLFLSMCLYGEKRHMGIGVIIKQKEK